MAGKGCVVGVVLLSAIYTALIWLRSFMSEVGSGLHLLDLLQLSTSKSEESR